MAVTSPTDAQPTTAASSTTSPGRARLTVPVALVVVLGALQGLGPLSLDTYLPALPTIAEELGASTSVTQLTLTATLVGLASGQVVFGPLSDARGRRLPLLAGLTLFVLASLACAVAPNVETLIALRAVQGFAAASGMVTATAVARDSSSGNAMARLFAALMLVTGVAPLVAPVLGGQLLLLTSWRGIFAMLGVLGAGLLAAALLPSSQKEREAARTVKEKAQPLGEQLGDKAKEIAQDLKAPAQEALQSVKETATESAQAVKAEGQDAAQEVKSDATDAAQRVKSEQQG